MASRLKPLVVVLAMAGVAGASWFQIHQVRASRPRVWAEVVRERDVRAMVAATGRARFGRDTLVSAPDDGRVGAVLVTAGQAVSAGQPLVTLDDAFIRLDLHRARSRGTAAAADVRRAQADVDRRRAQRDLARLARRRAEALSAAGVVADEAMARSRHDERLAELMLTSTRDAVAGGRAKARLAGADIRDIELRLSRQVVRAPVDGVVMEVFAQPGQPVHAGSTNVSPSRLLTLGVSGVTDIEVPLDVRRAASLQTGAHAHVAIAALGPRRLDARVVALDDRGGEEVLVRARLSEPPQGLLQGMSAVVEFTASSRLRTLAVPNHAVAGHRSHDPAGAGVWTVRDGVIALAPIVLGLRGDSYSEVLAGLTPGALVVTGPAAVIRTLGVGDRAIAVPAPIQAP